MKMLEKHLTVSLSRGIHGRIATKIMKIATRYNVRFCIMYEGKAFDCLSVLDILGLALARGESFTLRVSGDDPLRAMQAVEKLITERQAN